MAELTFGALIGFFMAYYVTKVKYTRNVEIVEGNKILIEQAVYQCDKKQELDLK